MQTPPNITDTVGLTIAVSGDTVINSRVSVSQDPGFGRLIDLFRRADVAFTHMEGTIHDFEGPQLYPAAESGWSWLRSAPYAADELKWAGFDVVSLASNHALDYSYGGLWSTWAALDNANIAHAGTGSNLHAARTPAFVDTPKGRVAVVSCSSTFPTWARAGAQRRDFKGRPGINPLRYYFLADSATAAEIREMARRFGWWVTVSGSDTLLNPPGVHHTFVRIREREVVGISTAPDEDDLDGNVRAVREAKRQADLVIVHLHSHEWNMESGEISEPAAFVQPFAHACLDAGADIFISQGSHAPVRGIELYAGKAIFYDPGDLFDMGHLMLRQPDDFYLRPDYEMASRESTATPTLGWAAAAAAFNPLYPKPAYNFSKPGMFAALCRYSSAFELLEIHLIPYGHLDWPSGQRGIPSIQVGVEAMQTLEHVARLSQSYSTLIDIADGVGHISVNR